MTLADLPDRIVRRIDPSGGVPTAPLFAVPGQCWLWRGWHNDQGYPYTHWEGRDQPVHRVVFAVVTGVDLDGLDLDHVCRRVECIRPVHHDAVSHAENQRRLGQAQTACRKAGHDWSDLRNVRVRKDGSRICAQCDRERCLAYYYDRKGGRA
jgi:hypothetical protein